MESTKPSFTFGTSRRTLSESNRVWAASDNSVPPPGAYNVDKSSRERYLRDLVGVTKWKIKNIKHKLRDAEALDVKKVTINITKTELDVLKQRLKALQDELQLISITEHDHKPKFSNATKPAFNSTCRKHWQEPVIIQEAPTFYMSDAEWDFGSDKRCIMIYACHGYPVTHDYDCM